MQILHGLPTQCDFERRVIISAGELSPNELDRLVETIGEIPNFTIEKPEKDPILGLRRDEQVRSHEPPRYNRCTLDGAPALEFYVVIKRPWEKYGEQTREKYCVILAAREALILPIMSDDKYDSESHRLVATINKVYENAGYKRYERILEEARNEECKRLLRHTGDADLKLPDGLEPIDGEAEWL